MNYYRTIYFLFFFGWLDLNNVVRFKRSGQILMAQLDFNGEVRLNE